MGNLEEAGFGSKTPGLAEAEIRFPIGSRRCANDDVIRQVNADRLTSLVESLGGVVIGPARARIAGRVIVHQDQGVGGMTESTAQDFGGMGETFAPGSPENFGDLDEFLVSDRQYLVRMEFAKPSVSRRKPAVLRPSRNYMPPSAAATA